jgi:hypothetical protein
LTSHEAGDGVVAHQIESGVTMTKATPFIGQILAMRARRCRPPRRRVFKLDLPRVIGEPRNGLTPTRRRLLVICLKI